MTRWIGLTVAAFLVGWLIASLRAQDITPEPSVCFGKVDAKAYVLAGMRRYTFTGSGCPMKGSWLVFEYPDDQSFVFVGNASHP